MIRNRVWLLPALVFMTASIGCQKNAEATRAASEPAGAQAPTPPPAEEPPPPKADVPTQPSQPGSGATAAPDKAQVEAAIAANNHCQTAADCEEVGSTCPFGCQILVNKEKADSIRSMIEAWEASQESPCTYRCRAPGEVQCQSRKCTVKQ